MADVIRAGTVEIAGDATGVKAATEDAKRSIRSLGKTTSDENTRASASIDRYITRLQTQAATAGKSARETELYKLSLRGASAAQLEAANTALRLNEAYQRGEVIGARLRAGLISVGLASAAIAAAITKNAIEQVASYQDLAEKIGDTGVQVASLKTAVDVSGLSFDEMAAASVRLTASLSKTDDEGKAVGVAIKALGLNFQEFKRLSPVEQLDAVAKAMQNFRDGSEKTAVAVALFGRAGAELMPFLNELGSRQREFTSLTQKQIDAVDKFADNLAELRSQVSRTAEGLAGPLVQALTDTIRLFQDGARHGEGFFETLRRAQGDMISRAFGGQASNQFTEIRESMESLEREITEIESGGGNPTRITALTAELDKLKAKRDSFLTGQRLDASTDPRSLGVGRATLDVSGLDTEATAKAKAEAEKRRKEAERIAKERRSRELQDAKERARELEQIAKAQLASDIDSLRNASEQVASLFERSEQELEAARAAGLVDERAYYDAKRALLIGNARAQEEALAREVDRLRAEQLAGADGIDNERKIADAQEKILRVRGEASTALNVLSRQEQQSLADIERGFIDAEVAAREYLETLIQAQERDLAGAGQGDRERGRVSGRSQIEDRYSEQRRLLNAQRREAEFAGTFGSDAQRRYDEELERIRRFQSLALAEFDVYYERLRAQEQDWTLGASEAINNYADSITDIAGQVEGVFTNAFQGMEDALVSFVQTGKLDFKSLANSIIADLARIAIQQAVMGPLLQAVGGLFGGGGGGFTAQYNAIGARAVGGPVSAGRMYEVNEKGPELLRVGGRDFLMSNSESGTVLPNRGGDANGARPIHVPISVSSGMGRNEVYQAIQLATGALEARINGILRNAGVT